MKDKGYYGIGIEKGKTYSNYWSLFRTAQILDVDFVFVIGERFKKAAPDTMKVFRHVPTYSFIDFADFEKHRPYDCPLIGIEMTPYAMEISKFTHPKKCIYLLGAEDNGLSKVALSKCQYTVKLHGERSMNVAAAGSIVLYDRWVKIHEEHEE